MIAHDMNPIFEFYVDTIFCYYYTGGTFPNNWSLDVNHATILVYDIDI